MKRLHVYISGRVQGVFFRAYTQETAQSLNLGGWVRNLPDGRVEAVFEGNEKNITTMLAWCKKGPPYAVVEKAYAQEEPFTGEFQEFKITY